MNDIYVLEWLETLYPNTLPNKELSPYELGVLVGQREVIEQLKMKFKIEEIVDEIVK